VHVAPEHVPDVVRRVVELIQEQDAALILFKLATRKRNPKNTDK
jgi:hypothetical protein